jgi:hypothetical protein
MWFSKRESPADALLPTSSKDLLGRLPGESGHWRLLVLGDSQSGKSTWIESLLASSETDLSSVAAHDSSSPFSVLVSLSNQNPCRIHHS